MEYGNKKKTFRIVIICEICVMLACLACMLILIINNDADEVFNDGINTELFHMLLFHKKQDEIKVHSVDAYYFDECYYYDVFHSNVSVLTGEWEDWELIYYGKGTLEGFLNPHWESLDEAEKYYEAYLEAVKRGQHKSFSQEEIQKYIDQYYASLEN